MGSNGGVPEESATVRVLHVLPDFDIGGGQVILANTISGLDDPSWEHVVVGFGGGPMVDTYRRAGIRCEILGNGRAAGWPMALRRLIALVKREQIDVIVSLNTPLDRTMAQLGGAATRRPVIVWFMSIAIPLLSFPPPLRRLPAFFKRLFLFPFNYLSVRRFAARVATSDAVARSFGDHLRLPTSAFEIVPPGIPDRVLDHQLTAERATELRAELGIDGADPVLLNVGMLIPLKGQLHLVEMLELVADDLPRSHLLLVGEGPDRSTLEQRIDASPIRDRVHLLGHRTDVLDLLRVSDGLLSASRSEGFGMSVLEAMAASKPVVAVRTPAFLEFVEDGTSAILVDSQDAHLLADAVKTVFRDPDRAEAMGTMGRARAESYRADIRAARFGEVLRGVTAVHRRGTR